MYNPQQNLLVGIRGALSLQLFPFDGYFPRMAEADVLSGDGDQMAAKSFFIRKAPFGGSHCLLGGVTEMLRTVADLPLDSDEFQHGMRDLDHRPELLDRLAKQKRLRLKIFSGAEGNPFFPDEPAVTAYGHLPDIRIWEGIATEALNFPCLSMTKWHRLVRVTRPGQVMEFARRRAQNHIKTTLYAMLAGCTSTSNVELRRWFDFKIGASMGHEWQVSKGTVKAGFDKWIKAEPRRPWGLVDTTQCMEVDFPAWLQCVWENRELIMAAMAALWGWRNDSGDLAALTIEQYLNFLEDSLAKEPWFWERMRIILTNDIDEHSAQSMIAQIMVQMRAMGKDEQDLIRRIIVAAGTMPGTCYDQASLGGVAKLLEVDDMETIKLAFDPSGKPGVKTSLAGFNRSALICNRHGDVQFTLVFPHGSFSVQSDGQLRDHKANSTLGEVIGVHPDDSTVVNRLKDYVAIPQQQLVYDSVDGDGFTEAWEDPTITSVPKLIMERVDRLGWQRTRLDKPEVMNVRISPDLFSLRRRMIDQRVLRSDQLAN